MRWTIKVNGQSLIIIKILNGLFLVMDIQGSWLILTKYIMKKIFFKNTKVKAQIIKTNVYILYQQQNYNIMD